MRIYPVLAAMALILGSSTATADASLTKADTIRLENEISEHLTVANAAVWRLTTDSQKLSAIYAKLDEKTTALRKASGACANGCSPAQGALVAAAAKDLETAQSTGGLQNIQLHNDLQAADREYTAVSNIMRIKHDTVKNSISNVR